eukprot:206097-Prorocentrum_minimum.AAC.1
MEVCGGTGGGLRGPNRGSAGRTSSSEENVCMACCAEPQSCHRYPPTQPISDQIPAHAANQ